MIYAQDAKHKYMLSAASVGSAATGTGYIDTRGFNYLSVDALMDSTATASNILTALHLSEGDTSTAFTTVAAFVAGGAGGFTIPTAMSSVNGQLIVMNMDLHGRKRYIKASITPGTAALICGFKGTLSRADVMPDSITEANVLALVNG